MHYHAMVNNPLYSGINLPVEICDGSSRSSLTFSGPNLPVCDGNGNLIPTSPSSSDTPPNYYLVSVSCSPAWNTLLPIGTNTITCTATDTAGNTGTASFTVTVVLEGAAAEAAAAEAAAAASLAAVEEEIVIPSWIKNNAGWWADDLIDDRNFVTGLQWLITNGIMVIG